MLKFVILVVFLFGAASADNFSADVTITWGAPRTRILYDGTLILMSLDNTSGCAWESNNQFLGGRFDVLLKLVPNDSAGTVTTFYLSSQGSAHDEIDFEFLGNSSGQPYTVHTNIYVQGVGNREQQFHLWFDPTIAFHTYSIVWNSQRVIYLVDNIPIRVFNNYEGNGVAFPTSQPMKVYASIWNADDWATQGGRVKTDWTKAPFIAYYKHYNANGCVVNETQNACNNNTSQAWQIQGLDAAGRNRIRWVQQKHMISNYCTQPSRFPNGLPMECNLPRF